MQRSKTVQGCYANWTVTLMTESPDEGDEAIEVPADVVTSVVECFRLAVNGYELGRDVDRRGRGRW